MDAIRKGQPVGRWYWRTHACFWRTHGASLRHLRCWRGGVLSESLLVEEGESEERGGKDGTCEFGAEFSSHATRRRVPHCLSKPQGAKFHPKRRFRKQATMDLHIPTVREGSGSPLSPDSPPDGHPNTSPISQEPPALSQQPYLSLWVPEMACR